MHLFPLPLPPGKSAQGKKESISGMSTPISQTRSPILIHDVAVQRHIQPGMSDADTKLVEPIDKWTIFV